ncbi:5-methyltetrahydropteroyltriglutamate--homocysteine S-methyltransferase [Egibacter rhizosphaerae]|uniref:5-methyltetrahydropteroyltriglutamate--homocysteine S-methyltransferase n=1 Tax=Egibacter rhizosphaerae TaxID=1670831 RepID=A0A411YIE4_9ACTN|nr:5-methyltetrahydropteroyltriglutamate--homocysteine S-methyltransferase [Egibacter rhizosphaerae]QBI21003.1 5-methyltetrahydropteroyltriglutamate--homocysteine S-methyltransferase [Egibacter rhizosphaerae]
MSLGNKPPFRADHVGSLLRPTELMQAREQHAAEEIDDPKLKEIEDRAITEVVAAQERTGLAAATDGEFRRASWHMDFIYQLGGITRVDSDLAVKFRNEHRSIEFTPSAPYVAEKLHLAYPIFGEHFSYLAEQVRTAVPKLTIPSPSMVHYRGGQAAIDPDVYPDIEEFWHDLSAVYAEQLAAVYELGCRYLQLDDVSLAYLNDPEQRRELAERGGDPDTQHLRYIRQINAAIADKPSDMTVTTHMCRGNFRSSWAAEGSYDFVAEALFSELDVDGFFLEYDDARSGGFEPLRYVPEGKYVVLGLVTSKSGELEDPDAIKRRIEEASKFVPLDQICISPQCGFSSTVEGNDLTHDQQWAKLRMLIDVAEDVWG